MSFEKKLFNSVDIGIDDPLVLQNGFKRIGVSRGPGALGRKLKNSTPCLFLDIFVPKG